MRLSRPFFLSMGVLFLALGVIGLFLPLLPTTPFLLVSAYCLSRGSEKFHNWLIHHKVLGPPIQNWQKNKAIPLKVKFIATLTMLITAAFVIGKDLLPQKGQIAYSLLLLAVMSFIWTRKSQ